MFAQVVDRRGTEGRCALTASTLSSGKVSRGVGIRFVRAPSGKLS